MFDGNGVRRANSLQVFQYRKGIIVQPSMHVCMHAGIYVLLYYNTVGL